jgi:hypothetical protein
MNNNQSNVNYTFTEYTYFQTEKSPAETNLSDEDLKESAIDPTNYIVPDPNCIYISLNNLK